MRTACLYLIISLLALCAPAGRAGAQPFFEARRQLLAGITGALPTAPAYVSRGGLITPSLYGGLRSAASGSIAVEQRLSPLLHAGLEGAVLTLNNWTGPDASVKYRGSWVNLLSLHPYLRLATVHRKYGLLSRMNLSGILGAGPGRGFVAGSADMLVFSRRGYRLARGNMFRFQYPAFGLHAALRLQYSLGQHTGLFLTLGAQRSYGRTPWTLDPYLQYAYLQTGFLIRLRHDPRYYLP
ncbi:MAG: hypothetical protein NW241_23620 [Bacteroidia bacterium]|nr:hypothetical protein [Bacteroidia bacterium]